MHRESLWKILRWVAAERPLQILNQTFLLGGKHVSEAQVAVRQGRCRQTGINDLIARDKKLEDQSQVKLAAFRAEGS